MSSQSEKRERTFTCLLSHPDKYLIKHLQNVAKLVEDTFPINDETLKKFAVYVAQFHDVGKATQFFQHYIRGEKIFSQEKNHSLLSAIILFYFLRYNMDENPLLSFLSYVAVKNHHSFPEDVFEDEGVLTDIDLLKKQLDSLEASIFSEMKVKIDPNSLKINLENVIKDFKPFRSLSRFKKKFGEVKDYFLYIAFLSICSALLFADRKDAVDVPEIKYSDISYLHFKSLIDSIPAKYSIDKLRQKAKDAVLSKVFDPSKRVYSINLPTGLGKTYTGFLYALKMREILKKQIGKNFRIIYALPFVSIIDQNFEIIKEKLQQITDSCDSSLIIKHHHLSEPEYRKDGESLPFDIGKVLTEGWESEIVVTTMVQLFNAIFPKNRSQALRFSRLHNTIVILDEIQTIPLKYWEIFSQIVENLAEVLDFYVLFMTATKPVIFPNCVELAGKEFFKGLNRYKIDVDMEKKTIDEFLSTFKFEEDKTYLFILNTIKSSQEFYKKLKEKVNGEIEYISASITPFERKQRLAKIKEGKVKYLVSTQVVEAGVDIDFDVVVRDFAPFDALNQSAGRCNRNGEKSGAFKIIRLVDEKGKFYWSYIYDSILSSCTYETLECVNNLTEEQFINLTEKYFKLVKDRAVDNVKELALFSEALKYLRFSGKNGKRFIKDMNLIENDYGIEVFVQINENAVNVWNKMIDIVKKLKSGERSSFKDYMRLKPKFYEFVIRVNVDEKSLRFFSEELAFHYIPFRYKDIYYGKTGLKEPNLIW
ncbi:CRISPR-associated helicase/endonuclease Cas3 [Desulfurobacterium atlanticum]|uniref:CRISPR-associated helicase, Cas3 family n=1 Tax=Desulfurobacterium atlanticum TaxID=240169 RepID=A0A239A430_9BACT|nr:CRISPR-associated helicase/endonuclease Cas3 [Desulfurobacterium atlanticum]SNR89663.1 CRISPR-associated helicase, Cas3 family [Desulfurobacterium atlanticum]